MMNVREHCVLCVSIVNRWLHMFYMVHFAIIITPWHLSLLHIFNEKFTILLLSTFTKKYYRFRGLRILIDCIIPEKKLRSFDHSIKFFFL